MKYVFSICLIVASQIFISNICYGEFVVPMYETDSMLIVLKPHSDINEYLDKTDILMNLHDNKKFIINSHNISKIGKEDLIFHSAVFNSKYNEKFAMDNCIILYEVNKSDLSNRKE